MSARQRDIACVAVRRSRLGVQVVPVVPDHDEAKILHRSPDGGARADDTSHRTAAYLKEPAIALGGTQICGQCHVSVGTEDLVEGLRHPRHVAVIRYDDDRALTG